jgi:hypothetical protein
MQQLNPQIKKKVKENFSLFFFFISLQNNATRKNDDKNKAKRMKRKLWLKAQITDKIRVRKCNQAISTTPILTLS